jgi:hypothetical protein
LKFELILGKTAEFQRLCEQKQNWKLVGRNNKVVWFARLCLTNSDKTNIQVMKKGESSKLSQKYLM